MAVGKSWTISVPITREGGTWGYIKVTFQEEYDPINNYSILSVTRMTGSNSIRSGGFQSAGTIYVNGGAWYSWNANHWVFSGLAGDSEFSTYCGASYPRGLVIYHDEDGRKTVEVAVNVSYYYGYDTNWSGNGGTVSQTVALTEIPRASELSVGNGRLGVAQTLLVDRKASGYTHTITYQCGGASGTICTQSSSTNVTWTPPIELARENTRGKTVDVAFTVTTYSGSTVIGTKTATASLTIPPSVGLRYEDGWATASPYNEGTAAEGMDAYVQGYSKVQMTFDSSKISDADAYGGEIAAYRITCNGKSFSAPYRTDVLSTAGGQTVTATVIDSRGYEVSQELSLFTEQYTKPALSDIVIFRCGEDGEKDDEGSYVSVTATGHISSIAGLNHAVLHISVGQVVSEVIPNGVTAIVGDGAVLHTSTYPVTLTLTDTLGNVGVFTQLLPTADVMFHGRKGGKGAAFGKYGEADDLLDVNWNILGRKNLDIDGAVSTGGVLSVGESVELKSDNEGGNIVLRPNAADNTENMKYWSMDTNSGVLRIFGEKDDGQYVFPFTLYRDGSMGFGNVEMTRKYLGAAPLTTIQRKFGNYGGTTAGNCNYFATAEMLYLGENRYLVRLIGKIGTSSTASIFTYGVHTPKVLNAINEQYGTKYTKIQRTKTGSAKVYKLDGSLEVSGIGYGYIVDSAGDGSGGFAYDYLAPGRIYTNDGAEGLWPMDAFFGYINNTGYLDVVAEFQCS